ncbi:MAG: hypothetical protein WKF75_16600 [Singulisphaera sp.]
MPKATVKWLDKEAEGGNAQIQLEFGGAARPGGPVELSSEGRRLAMKQVGGAGNRFSAIIKADFEELGTVLKDMEKVKGGDAEAVEFVGRQMVRAPRQNLIRADQLKPGFVFDPCNLPAFPGLVDRDRSLMIVHPKVVDVVGNPSRTYNPCTNIGTPMGVWTFGHVMKVLCDEPNTGIDPAVFTRRWLAQWETDQVINNFTIPRRTRIRDLIIDPWQAASGGAGKPLDLSKAPFRLLAIVNRVDLRDNLLFEIPPAALMGGPGAATAEPPTVIRDSNAGEARLVFGALDSAEGLSADPFHGHLEFGINKKDCHEQRAWAKKWYDLKNHPIGSAAYNAALQAITDQFIKPAPDRATMPRPNGLNQVRTNEIALTLPDTPPPPRPPVPPLWELREFRVAKEDSDRGHLRSVTVKQTPDTISLNTTARVAQFVNANTAQVLNNSHTVPLLFPTFEAFLGARRRHRARRSSGTDPVRIPTRRSRLRRPDIISH